MESSVITAPSPASVIQQDIAQRVYRIAVYGLAGSGKTCLLAALAMPRYANPAGISATWSTNSEQSGKAWLYTAINALEKHEVPPPNPNSAQRLAFDFHFAHHGHTYTIQIFDYAGELVSPTALDSDNARRLFKELEGMDGLIILAPVLRPGEDHQPISNDLYGLQRTFASFTVQRYQNITRPQLPIAIIYNKWDLRSHLEHDTPEQEWKKLEVYLQLAHQHLNNPIPHRAFYSALHSALLPKDIPQYQLGDLWQRYCIFRDAQQPIRYNFMAFPVSAFGEYITDYHTNGTAFDRPKEINPLHAFGLEDPFLWIVYRSQELTAETEDQTETAMLAELQRELKRLESVNSGWRLLQIGSVHRLLVKTRKFLAQLTQPKSIFARYLELHKRRVERLNHSEAIYTQLRNIRVKQNLVAAIGSVLLGIFTFLGAEFVQDSYHFAKINDILNDPLAQQSSTQWAEHWQQDYVRSSALSHWLYATLKASKTQVAEQLKTIRAKRESLLVTEFTNTNSDLKNRSELAARYLKLCDLRCTYRTEAQDVQQQYLRQQDSNDWEQARLNTHNTEVAILAYLKQHPQGAYIDAAYKILKHITETKDWQAFKASYNDYAHNGEVLEAARLLTDRPISRSAEELRLRKGFPEWAAAVLEPKIQSWQEHQEWGQAINYLERIKQLPAKVWPTKQRQRVLNGLINRVKQAWDRSLYQAVYDYRDVGTTNAYLSQAPLGTMKSIVTKYLEYLNQRDQNNHLKLILKQIQWNGHEEQNVKVMFKLTVRTIQVESPELVKDRPVNLMLNFTAKYSDVIPIRVRVVRHVWWQMTDALIGDASANVLVKDLSTGYQLTLRDTNDVATGQAFLILAGGALNNEPELPIWSMP